MLNLFQLFVACVTEKYIQSDFCRREVALADALKKRMVPLLFGGVTWPVVGPMSLPFTELGYVNCSKGLVNEKLRQNAAQAVKRRIGMYTKCIKISAHNYVLIFVQFSQDL